jgi:hypothetical protein
MGLARIVLAETFQRDGTLQGRNELGEANTPISPTRANGGGRSSSVRSYGSVMDGNRCGHVARHRAG